MPTMFKSTPGVQPRASIAGAQNRPQTAVAPSKPAPKIASAAAAAAVAPRAQAAPANPPVAPAKPAPAVVPSANVKAVAVAAVQPPVRAPHPTLTRAVVPVTGLAKAHVSVYSNPKAAAQQRAARVALRSTPQPAVSRSPATRATLGVKK
jgi:hypothetical protein